MERPFAQSRNSVLVTQIDDEWEVSVSQEGKLLSVHFLLEAHARSFADRQRARLGLMPQARKLSLEGEAGIIASNEM